MKTANEYLPTKYWLMKSEPSTFSFQNLTTKKSEFWDGVRNYQARNFMMQHMKVGHKILFYHSNCQTPGIIGECEVVAEASPDLTAQDSNSKYYDPNATTQNPIWYGVTVGKPIPFPKPIPLDLIKKQEKLTEMLLLRRGQRLSIQPLSEAEYKSLIELGLTP